MIKSILLCGTTKGYIYYLIAPYLVIKNQLYVEKKFISFVCSSKNFDKLAYSTEDGLKIIDFKSNRVIYNHKQRIWVGIFLDKVNCFVFSDTSSNIYILQGYINLLKICSGRIYQIYLTSDLLKLIFRNPKSSFHLCDLNNCTVGSYIKRLRLIDKDLRFTKRSLIISCIRYNCVLVI